MVRALGILILILLFTVATVSKITTGYLLTVIMIGVFVHGQCWQRKVNILVLLIALAAILALVKLVFSSKGHSAPEFRTFYGSIMMMSRVYFIRNVFCYLLPLMFVVVGFIRHYQCETWREFLKHLKAPPNSDVAIAICLYVAAGLPVVLINFADNEMYFHWTAPLLSLPIAAFYIAQAFPKVPVLIQSFVVYVLIGSCAAISANELFDLASDTLQTRRALSAAEGHNAGRRKVVDALFDLGRTTPLSEKRETCLYITQEVVDWWVPDGPELADVFMPTAITGYAMLDGCMTDVNSIHRPNHFSINMYTPRKPGLRKHDELLQAARNRGFSLLIIARKEGEQIRFDRYSCP